MGKKDICICSFDHETNEPKGLRGAALDRHVLSTSKRVSVFWLTETQARARRIDYWQSKGILDLDNKSFGYPWLGVKKFDAKAAE